MLATVLRYPERPVFRSSTWWEEGGGEPTTKEVALHKHGGIRSGESQNAQLDASGSGWV